MELKVLVDGEERVVTGLTEDTTCQEIIYALAHSVGQIGRFALVEQWRSSERSLAPNDRPLQLLTHWAEHAPDVRFELRHLDIGNDPQSSSMIPATSSSRPQSSMMFQRPIGGAQMVQSTSASSLQSSSSRPHDSSLLSVASSHGSNVSLANRDASLTSNQHRRHIHKSNRPPPPTYDQVMQRRQSQLNDTNAQQLPNYNWPAGRDDLIKMIQLQDVRLGEQQRMLHNAVSLTHRSSTPTNHHRELHELSQQMAQYTEHKRRLQQEIEICKRKNNQLNNTNSLNSNSTNSLIRLKAHVAQLDTQLSAKNREIESLNNSISDYQKSADDSEQIDLEIQRIEAAIVLRREKLQQLRQNEMKLSPSATASTVSPNESVPEDPQKAGVWSDDTNKKPGGVWV